MLSPKPRALEKRHAVHTAWAFRIQKNIVIDEWRKENPVTAVPGLVDEEGKPKKIRVNVRTRGGNNDVATIPVENGTLLKAEVAVVMERLSTILSPVDLKILWLTEYEGMKSAEVGELLAMLDYEVRRHLVEIRALLKTLQWN